MNLPAEVFALLGQHAGPRPRVVVAYSGGLDSTVLAHSLAQARRKLGSLRLVHVDHGLQSASAEWRAHCERQARAWKVPFIALTANVVLQRGDSLEAVAREARYAALSRNLAAGEVLVTAQHQDDQAETLLLQLFRGAGVPGLAAMPAKARFAQGLLVRPLLEHTRAELETYARRHRLKWVDDPTNQHERFARNFLRHRVMPTLRARWAGVDAAIARTARHLAEAAELLDTLARQDLVAVIDGDGLNVAALRRLTPARRRNVLRAFVTRHGGEAPSTAQMQEIGRLLTSRADAQPEVRWSGGAVRRRAGRLLLEANSSPPDSTSETVQKSWHWDREREWGLSAGGALALIDDPEGAVDLDKLPRTLHARARLGGEKLRPAPRARTQALKKLLQAAKLTVEDRARLPLLFTGPGPKGRLIAAGDRWLDASVMANVKSRRRARLVWTRSS